MARPHNSQEETGFWQLSLEDHEGALTLISNGFSAPDHVIEDAGQLVEKARCPAQQSSSDRERTARSRALARNESSKPAP
jgi:hypothetical protein